MTGKKQRSQRNRSTTGLTDSSQDGVTESSIVNMTHPSTLPQSLPRTAKGAPSYVASEWTDKSLDLYFHAVLHGLDNDVLCCLSSACKYVHICRPSRQILTLLYESRRRPCRHSLKSKSWCNTQAIKIIVWFGGGNRNRTSRTHVLALGCQVLVHLAKIGRVEKKNTSQEPRFTSVASKVLASVVAALVSWMIGLET